VFLSAVLPFPPSPNFAQSCHFIMSLTFLSVQNTAVYFNPIIQYTDWFSDPDSSVTTATRNGLHGPGIESRWQRNFPPPIQVLPGAHPASYTMGTSYFSGSKRPWRRTDPPAASSSGLQISRSYTSMFRLCLQWPVIGCEIFPP
jgi:hypothetical protein